MGHALLVDCRPSRGGWRCGVTVGDDAGATRHEVGVDASTLDDLAPGADPEPVVRVAFEFLLGREPRESILRTFELGEIGRYFPDWRAEVRRRISS